MRPRLILLALQLVFINLVLLSGAALYELLPRFLNAMLGYFIVPIALVAGFKALTELIFAGLRIELADEDAPTMAFGIAAVTAWLGLALGGYLDVFDYPALRLGESVGELDPHDAASKHDAVMVSFTSGVVAEAALGLEQKTANVKSGELVTKVHHSYAVVPFVGAGWEPTQPIEAWFCLWESGPKPRPEAEVLAEALQSIPVTATAKDPVRGLSMRDAATIDHCEEAIEDAQARHGVRSHPSALLLRHTPEDEASLLAKSARRFWIFVAIYNVLWLLPALFVRLEPAQG